MKQVVLNGKELANKLEIELKEKMTFLKEKSGKNATLATIIVGDNPSSQIYVKMKGNKKERFR